MSKFTASQSRTFKKVFGVSPKYWYRLYHWDPDGDAMELAASIRRDIRTERRGRQQTFKDIAKMSNTLTYEGGSVPDFFKTMKSGTKYHLETIETDDAQVVSYKSKVHKWYKKHARLYQHTFTEDDRRNHDVVSHFESFYSALEAAAYRTIPIFQLVPLPNNVPSVRNLPVRNSPDINCMIKVIANNYPRRKKEIIEFAKKLFETEPETIASLQFVAKKFHHKYTCKNFQSDTIETIKGGASGTRNLNIYIHDGHAFQEELKFLPIDDVKYMKRRELQDSLSKEQNAVIKVYENENEQLTGYRKHTGQCFVWEQFKNTQDKVNEVLKLERVHPFMSTFAMYFAQWVEVNDFRPTRFYVDEIKAATMECVIWGKNTLPPCDYVDRNNAFNSITYQEHEAHPYYKKYKIPQNCHHYMHDPAYNFIKDVTGIVHVKGGLLQHLKTKNPYIVKLLSKHASNWYPTPTIVHLVDRRLINKNNLVFKKVIWGTSLREIEWTTDDHHFNRQFIGKCFQNQSNSTYHITCKQYHAFMVHKLQQEGTLVSFTDNTITMRGEASHQYLEVRSFVMAYHIMGNIDMCLKYGDDIHYMGVDDMFVTKGELRERISTKPGEWKTKSKEYLYQFHFSDVETMPPVELPDKDEPFIVPEGHVILECYKHQISRQRGRPGFGKSHMFDTIVKKYDPDKYVVLCPTKALAKKKRNKHGIHAVHWQRYFGASYASPDWHDRDAKITKGQNKCLVIIDEIYTWNDSDVRDFLTFLKRSGSTIILIGDDKQIKPFNGRDNCRIIDRFVDYECPELTKDWRSKDEFTAKFKESLRGLKEETALSRIKQTVGSTDWEEFLAEWTPQSLVYATTNSMNTYLTKLLHDIHKRKFPQSLVPYEFKKDTTWCGEEYYNGDVIYLPFQQVIGPKQPAPDNIVLAYTSTVHKSLGDSVQDNVFIIEDRNSSLWCQNGLYVAATRIEDTDQLYLVEVPENLMQRAHTVDRPLDKQIERRIKQHTEQDAKKFRDTDIDPEYIRSIICEKCTLCGTTLKYNNYYDRDSHAWSIDRIDNNLGHIKGNCRITCYSCNIHKKR